MPTENQTPDIVNAAPVMTDAVDLASDALSRAPIATDSTPESPENAKSPDFQKTPKTPENTETPEKTPGDNLHMGVDALGRPFDAAKFHPRKGADGRWINKNVGRKRKSGDFQKTPDFPKTPENAKSSPPPRLKAI